MNKTGLIILVIAAINIAVVYGAADGYFWHISDTHSQLDYKAGSDPEKECTSGKGSAGKFGDYKCRSPYIVEKTAFTRISEIIPPNMKGKKPEFVLWTGDGIAHYKGKYSKEGITLELKNLTALFKHVHTALGGKVPIFPVVGNHDTYPQHQLPATNYWAYDLYASLWKDFLSAEAVKTLKKGGYYTELIKPGLRIIVLNTVLYYTGNHKIPLTEKDPGGQMAWLTSQLKSAKAKGESVYIASHIPPGPIPGCFHKEFLTHFLDAMKGYHSIIRGSFFGHVHRDLIGLLGDAATTDFSPAFIISTATGQGRNPIFRYYTFDSQKKYAIQDWTTIYLDVPAANKAGKVTWKELYTATTEYGIPDVSPAHLKNLALKFKTDDALFQKYYQHRVGNKSGVGKCTGDCKKEYVCYILTSYLTQYEKCIKNF